MPVYLTEHPHFIKDAVLRGIKANQILNSPDYKRTESINPQKIVMTFIDETADAAEARDAREDGGQAAAAALAGALDGVAGPREPQGLAGRDRLPRGARDLAVSGPGAAQPLQAHAPRSGPGDGADRVFAER